MLNLLEHGISSKYAGLTEGYPWQAHDDPYKTRLRRLGGAARGGEITGTGTELHPVAVWVVGEHEALAVEPDAVAHDVEPPGMRAAVIPVWATLVATNLSDTHRCGPLRGTSPIGQPSLQLGARNSDTLEARAQTLDP